MQRHIAIVAWQPLLALLFGCGVEIYEDIEIWAPETDPKTAQALASQYIAMVPLDNRGDSISISRCAVFDFDLKCDFFIAHYGNECSWGSRVLENCDGAECTYEMTPYDEEMWCE